MPLPQQPVRRGRRLTIAVAVSVAAHFGLLLGVARDARIKSLRGDVEPRYFVAAAIETVLDEWGVRRRLDPRD